MDFAQVVRSRRMVRSFRTDSVAADKLQRVLRVARTAPSAGFSQGQSFVVVQRDDQRARIAAIAGEDDYVRRGFDPWLSNAPVHVVCCTSEAAYHERYREPDKVDREGRERPWRIPFWYVDAGCSLMLLLLAAVDEGLAAGFLRLDEPRTSSLRELLGIPKDVEVIGVVTLGIPARDRRSRSLDRGWKPEEAVIRWDRW
jgi:nitroreductase